jgi:hypothetical protein
VPLSILKARLLSNYAFLAKSVLIAFLNVPSSRYWSTGRGRVLRSEIIKDMLAVSSGRLRPNDP